MRKDIDINITRQLWERLKNTFSRNDVIPVENGGTGETDLNVVFQKSTVEYEEKLFTISDVTKLNNVIVNDDCSVLITINKNSMSLRNTVSLTRDNTTNVTLPSIEFPVNTEANINNVLVATGTRMSIKNKKCTLSFQFINNVSKINFNTTFIPFI